MQMGSDANQLTTPRRADLQSGTRQDIGLSAGQIPQAEVGIEIAVTTESNRASRVLNEGRLLAGLLQHEEYSVAHLLLAISRTPDGASELSKWDVKARNVNLLCWKALEQEQAVHHGESNHENPSARAAVSGDVMEVHRRAGIIAAGKKQGILELADLVEAIVASRISPRFVHLYAAEPAEAILAEIHGKLDHLQVLLLAEFDKRGVSLIRELRNIRYLGFALLVAILMVSMYFGLR